MKTGKLPELKELLRARVGSARCGLLTQDSDVDIFVLNSEVTRNIYDAEKKETYFLWSLPTFWDYWGHPLLAENVTGDCTGNGRLCTFLQERRRKIVYAAPERTVIFGLQHIAYGEMSGFNSTIKLSLRIAMELSHMARGDEDPILFSPEEKAILLRARTGDVPPEERVELYRRTISPENINRLIRMQDHPTIKNELFQLIEEVISC